MRVVVFLLLLRCKEKSTAQIISVFVSPKRRRRPNLFFFLRAEEWSERKHQERFTAKNDGREDDARESSVLGETRRGGVFGALVARGDLLRLQRVPTGEFSID